jgi:hypothetical protein
LGYINISAYTIHAVFLNQGWNKIISNGFKRFYTTNTVPEVVEHLKKIDNSPFVILELFGSSQYVSKKIYVSSHNEQKLQAAWNQYSKNEEKFVVYVVNVSSDVPNQPIGKEQTKQGSLNRLNNMEKYLYSNNIKYDILISFKNGINKNNNNLCCDFCCITYKKNQNMTIMNFHKILIMNFHIMLKKNFIICVLNLNKKELLEKLFKNKPEFQKIHFINFITNKN